MKGLILAAGRGTRIESVTHGAPKCLLRFGSRFWTVKSRVSGRQALRTSESSSDITERESPIMSIGVSAKRMSSSISFGTLRLR